MSTILRHGILESILLPDPPTWEYFDMSFDFSNTVEGRVVAVPGAIKYEYRWREDYGQFSEPIDIGNNTTFYIGPFFVEGTIVGAQVRVTTAVGTSDWNIESDVIIEIFDGPV